MAADVQPAYYRTADNSGGVKMEIGDDLSKAILAVTEGSTIHFLVTSTKGPNYSLYCDEVVLPNDPVSTIKTYTEHTNDLYSKVNIALASDSPKLEEHGGFIKQLRASVLAKPLLDDTVLFRGVELSGIEIEQMEKLKRFFIPSFTSTSVDPKKAYEKNSVLNVRTEYLSRFACSITPELSMYHSTEQEVLIACYSAFVLDRVEKVNGKNVLTLFLDEFGSVNDRL